ncbi:MAG: hypothetical protein Kow00127_10040 [Bacteroidales bacterium]
MKLVISSTILLALLLLLASWGWQGHYMINHRAELSYNQEMMQFYDWSQLLAEHASDADERKAWDPDEGPKHYIDIDNYPEFVSTGAIPQDWDQVIATHGSSFVYDQGILPWATRTTFDSLREAFQREDWDQAILFAADLGHYVADGHMPLHITRNYNGQYTGNNGIHGRYESDMVNAFAGEIYYGGMPVTYIEDPQDFIFGYLYENYQYVDSVIMADDYAQAVSGSTGSQEYLNALWEKTGNFTTRLFRWSSYRLACLIYTAWVDAGSPLISGVFPWPENYRHWNLKILQNPVREKLLVSFTLPGPETVTASLTSPSGEVISLTDNEEFEQGKHLISYPTATLRPGLWLLNLSVGNKHESAKVILLH